MIEGIPHLLYLVSQVYRFEDQTERSSLTLVTFFVGTSPFLRAVSTSLCDVFFDTTRSALLFFKKNEER